MSTPAESASLILKLYDLRREETMRKARDFMVTFDPKSFEEIPSTMFGPNGSYVRMVFSYWEMAAALVQNGAIDPKMFTDCNGEHLLVFARIEPYLPQIREMFGNPQFLSNLEQLILSAPDARQRLDGIRERMRKVLEQRAAMAQKGGN